MVSLDPVGDTLADMKVFDECVYALDDDMGDLGGLQDMLDLWRSKCIEGKLPSFSDFTFQEFSGWHARMCLTVIDYNAPSGFPEQYEKIVGEDYRFYYGSLDRIEDTLKIKGTYDPYKEADYNGSYRVYMEKMIATKGIGVFRGVHPKTDASKTSITILDLPLSDDGETITHFMAFLEPANK